METIVEACKFQLELPMEGQSVRGVHGRKNISIRLLQYITVLGVLVSTVHVHKTGDLV